MEGTGIVFHFTYDNYLLSLVQLYTFKNFKILDNELIWQKVFPLKIDQNAYFYKLKSVEFLNSLLKNNNIVSGKSNNKDLKIKSPYWASFPFNCFVKIEFKDTKYRVTISNIIFDGPEIEVYGVKNKLDYKLSENVLQNGKMKNSKKIRNVTSELDKFFQIRMAEKSIEEKDDW